MAPPLLTFLLLIFIQTRATDRPKPPTIRNMPCQLMVTVDNSGGESDLSVLDTPTAKNTASTG
jgi:hypothetical protein